MTAAAALPHRRLAGASGTRQSRAAISERTQFRLCVLREPARLCCRLGVRIAFAGWSSLHSTQPPGRGKLGWPIARFEEISVELLSRGIQRESVTRRLPEYLE